mgnify:FL=1
MATKIEDPNKLFDELIKQGGLKNDAALARSLNVAAPTISNMRACRLAVGPSLIVSIIEHFHMPLQRIRRLLAGSE